LDAAKWLAYAAMTLRGRLRRSPLGIGANRTSDSDARDSLSRALKHERGRLAVAKTAPLDVQLVGQVTPAVEWPKLLAYWERRNPGGVASWPRQLQPDEYALNLWPLPPGRIRSVTGIGGDVRRRQPKKTVCTPGLTVFGSHGGATAETALAVVITTWLGDIGADFVALHYALDLWLVREFPGVPFEGYADDVILHCNSKPRARVVLDAIVKRLALEVNPGKTRIVYCKDSNRTGSHEHERFDFLGYTFRPRSALDRSGGLFVSFSPAISGDAAKAICRRWQLHLQGSLSLADLARKVNPVVRGWINRYGRFYPTELLRSLDRINQY
jgi:Group II intron, maturase-specific domain/Reverse transcriptase (RNA-dependent DNA polymerase)